MVDEQEGDGKPDHPRIGGDVVEEDGDQRARREPHDDRHQRHEADPDDERGPAGAADPGAIVATQREADPDRRRLPHPQRHHEGDRRNLQRDGVGGDAVGVDQAHEVSCGAKHRAFEGHRQPDRQAETNDGAEAAPVGAPPAAEQMESAELAIGGDHQGETDREHHPDDRTCQTAAENTPGGKPEPPENQSPAEQGIGGDSDRADAEDPAWPLERREEVAHRLEQQEGENRPHVAAQEDARVMRQAGLLAEPENERFGIPQDRPEDQAQ